MISDIKSHYLFGRYLAYHSRSSGGQIELYKISESNFIDFEKKYLSDTEFQERVNRIYCKIRVEKLDEILKKDL